MTATIIKMTIISNIVDGWFITLTQEDLKAKQSYKAYTW